MELFTEIEFSSTEFGKIDKVLYFLSNEGWDVIDTIEHSSISENHQKFIKAKKYKFRREI